MRRRMIALAGVAVIVAATFGSTQAATADSTPAPDLELLRPTGTHPVGVTRLHLVDTERADPWLPEENRELMVSVWYPAKRGHGETAEYMTPAESREYLVMHDVDLPPRTLSTVDTHARLDAKPANRRKRPLILLSPGWTQPRATLSGLAEDLASRGYVVAAIGHNYETVTEFPDGRVTTCEACGRDALAKAVSERARDASFVIDELTDRRGWRGSRLIDTDRIAMAGHSLGGAAAYAAMLADDRITAGINLDGRVRDPGTATYDRPFLLLGSQHRTPGSADGWTDVWDLGEGWKRWITVAGTAHSSFTDIGLLGPQAGIANPEQTLAPKRCVELTRDLVSAFFDRQLRGEHRPILDGPTPDDPELTFHNP